MLSLLSSRFYKLFHSKSTYVLLAIAFGLPVLSGLLMVSLGASLGEGMEGAMQLINSAKSLLAASVDVASNNNILVIIGVAIFSGGLFSEGTIRNSIMAGKSRAKIYFAEFIVAMVWALMVITLASVTSVVVNGLTTGWGDGTVSQLLTSYFTSYALALLVAVLVATLALMFVFVTKKKSLSIVFPIVITAVIGGVSATVIQLSQLLIFDVTAFEWVPVVQLYFYSMLQKFEDWALIGKISLMTTVTIALITLLGWNAIAKSDIK